ncbi:MAG: MDR family oxidoreductase [Glaciecola sp.]
MPQAIQITNPDGVYQAALTDITEAPLESGQVRIKVAFSTINYKDALAITGKGKIIRDFPMTPGIDCVGTVTETASDAFAEGDTVVLNGFGCGERFHGGLTQSAIVNADHLIALPKGISERHAMMLGTAGYTAMLCVSALQQAGVTPEQGEVLVTGANGGVGTVSVMLLSALGYTVVASTGRVEESEFLTGLGASAVIHRDELNAPGKPLAKERWAGVVDSLGSHTLANACASTKYGGAVAACGLAQGMDFPSSVAPFILRGVKLLGIDSVYRPIADREQAWKQLAELIDVDKLAELSTAISMDEVIDTASQLLAGKVRGRVVVEMS